MRKPLDIPGFGSFMRADQMPLPPNAGANPNSHGDYVHSFWENNPNFGVDPKKAALYKQLMGNYGIIGPNMGYDPEAPDWDMQDPRTQQMFAALDASAGLAQSQIPGDVAHMRNSLFDMMAEAYENQESNRDNNFFYDLEQPYGFDFGNEHFNNQIMDNRQAVNEEFGPIYESVDDRAFPRAYTETPAGEVYAGNGAYVAQPGEEGFLGGAKNALAPIAQTAGSMVLPMLFSMLMRGGK